MQLKLKLKKFNLRKLSYINKYKISLKIKYKN